MAGFGFLRHMIDSIKYNSNILGKKRPLKELNTTLKSGYGKTGNPQHLKKVVDMRAAKRRKELIRNRIIALSIAVFFILFWLFITHKYYSPHFGKKKTYFEVRVRQISENELIRTHYYILGGKAQDTRYRNGLRHQNSESYYETGEQFRSALYYKDTLITEIFLSKQLDTLSVVLETKGKVYSTLWLKDRRQQRIIQVGYQKGRIIPSTYMELPLPDSLR